MNHRLLTAAAVAALALGTTGCLIGRTENTKFSGRYVSEETLQQVEPGDSQDEVVSLLGQPSSKTEKPSGTTVWRYGYHKATTRTGAVFLLFGSTVSTETEGAVYVEFDDDDKVVKTWSER
jgi:outer membrane protein assembly factor BamE (lipoprotein component of BamABCDE complex)